MNPNDGNNSEEKHWSSVEYIWVTYKDKDRTEIEKIYLDVPGENYPKHAIRRPASRWNDPPTPEELFVQYLTVTKLDDLYRLAHQYDTAFPKPLYRGQSDYSWSLETHLERGVADNVIKDIGLERYELKIMYEAQQRFHEFYSQLPEEEDLLSWLSFLRHQGVPTRLLDVTRSLYIACYFAVRDARPGIDAAVWIFSPSNINKSFDHWGYKANNSWLRESIFTVHSLCDELSFPYPKNPHKQYSPPTLDYLKGSFDELNFEKVIDAALRGYIDKPGIAVLEPFWISRRLASQQGAFLVPFNVRYGFEYNLFYMLKMLRIETPERNVPEDGQGLFDLWSEAKIIKLRIPADLHDILKLKLETMNIRELTLFPDLNGTLTHLSSIIPRERK